jgi:hypothetical protein
MNYYSVLNTDVGVFVWGDGTNGQLGLGPSVESSFSPLFVFSALLTNHYIFSDSCLLQTRSDFS